MIMVRFLSLTVTLQMAAAGDELGRADQLFAAMVEQIS